MTAALLPEFMPTALPVFIPTALPEFIPTALPEFMPTALPVFMPTVLPRLMPPMPPPPRTNTIGLPISEMEATDSGPGRAAATDAPAKIAVDASTEALNQLAHVILLGLRPTDLPSD